MADSQKVWLIMFKRSSEFHTILDTITTRFYDIFTFCPLLLQRIIKFDSDSLSKVQLPRQSTSERLFRAQSALVLIGRERQGTSFSAGSGRSDITDILSHCSARNFVSKQFIGIYETFLCGIR